MKQLPYHRVAIALQLLTLSALEHMSKIALIAEIASFIGALAMHSLEWETLFYFTKVQMSSEEKIGW